MDLAANPKSKIQNPKWDNFRSPAALARFYLTMAVGLVIDLWSKAYAWQALHVEGPDRDPAGKLYVHSEPAVEFIPGWLHFKLTVNEGAVFGLGQGAIWLFLAVSLGAIVFLTYLFASSERQRFIQVVYGVLLAGVFGNMYDRIRYGYVRDMIYALPDWSWPGTWQIPVINYPSMPHREVFPWIFNVADMFLCTGVALIVAYSLLVRQDHRERIVTQPAAVDPVRP